MVYETGAAFSNWTLSDMLGLPISDLHRHWLQARDILEERARALKKAEQTS